MKRFIAIIAILFPVSACVAPEPLRCFASFPRSQSLSLFRSIAAERASRSIPNRIVRARLALEDSSSFVIIACDDEDERSVFVCSAVGCDVHRIDAVLWSHHKRQHAIFQDLNAWHAEHFPDTALVPGTLRDRELAAWNLMNE